MRVVTTDVAVIGGGAAGCYAALNLSKRGLKPLIICKGLVGKSGASLFAGNLVISGRALGNSEENARNTAEFLIKYHNQFLIDQSWAQRCGQFIEKVYYPELEEAGLYFRRDDSGEMVTSPGPVATVRWRHSITVMIGLNAAETGWKARMSAVSAAPVAIAVSSS